MIEVRPTALTCDLYDLYDLDFQSQTSYFPAIFPDPHTHTHTNSNSKISRF